MKMKSFAVLVASGLLGCMAPAMADDAASTDQAPAMSNSQSQDDNNSQSPSANIGSTSDAANTNAGAGPGATPSATDEGGPDTATGDDDY